MTRNVLIIHPDSRSTRILFEYFQERGDRVRQAATSDEAYTIVAQNKTELVLFDLHTADNGWRGILDNIRQASTNTKILFTSDYPDPQHELRAKKDFGARVFLQQPFTRARIAQALWHLENDVQATLRVSTADRPKVRVPVRVKITFPYVILALLFALAASFIVSRVVLDTIEERFTNQLIEAGKLANDWMVQEEDRLLEFLRLLAHTRGVPEAVAAGNAESLREIALPLAVNNQEEAVEILDHNGVSVLSLRHQGGPHAEAFEASRGETIYNQWPFVWKALDGQVEAGRDKQAGLAQTSWGDYIYVAGPITDDSGMLVGVVLVGKSLPNLVSRIRQDILAQVTIYDLSGLPLASSLLSFEQESLRLDEELVSTIITNKDHQSLTRPISIASINYTEIVGPLEVREFAEPLDVAKGESSLGLVGVALAETFLARPSQVTRIQVFVLTSVAFLLVIGLGLYVANRITKPLMQVAEASAQVAQGNLDVQVDAGGDDEVAVLAHSFNEMVSGLQEGALYRDLLGRTVSPEVREELRQRLASGDLQLAGQDAEAAVLISDIRGFTTLSETEDSATVMTWLNEYFEELVPVITEYGGVVSKFEGDSVLAFFGILPRPLSPEEAAYQACQASLAIIEALNRLNDRRGERGDPPFTAGVGLNTGPVMAGALGSADRMHYTIIGDTVNTTARLEGLTRQFGSESSVVISQHTLFALGDRRHEFQVDSMGAHTVKGKAEQLLAYRLQRPK